jgi:hypothetical protein
MKSLKITPGAHNGEDISVIVTVTSQESNPSETGQGEIAVEKVEVVDAFTIPIDPVIVGEPRISTQFGSANGTEDIMFDIGIIKVSLDGTEDPDGSEVYYVEIVSEIAKMYSTESKHFL